MSKMTVEIEPVTSEELQRMGLILMHLAETTDAAMPVATDTIIPAIPEFIPAPDGTCEAAVALDSVETEIADISPYSGRLADNIAQGVTANFPVEMIANSEEAMEGAAIATQVPVDSRGLPWDERIHASSKARIKSDDTWRYKRGVSNELIDQVEAELTGLMQLPVPPPAAPVPPPAAHGSMMTFIQLLQEVTKAGIPKAKINAACNKLGLKAFPLIANRPDLFEAFRKEVYNG